MNSLISIDSNGYEVQFDSSKKEFTIYKYSLTVCGQNFPISIRYSTMSLLHDTLSKEFGEGFARFPKKTLFASNTEATQKERQQGLAEFIIWALSNPKICVHAPTWAILNISFQNEILIPYVFCLNPRDVSALHKLCLELDCDQLKFEGPTGDIIVSELIRSLDVAITSTIDPLMAIRALQRVLKFANEQTDITKTLLHLFKNVSSSSNIIQNATFGLIRAILTAPKFVFPVLASSYAMAFGACVEKANAQVMTSLIASLWVMTSDPHMRNCLARDRKMHSTLNTVLTFKSSKTAALIPAAISIITDPYFKVEEQSAITTHITQVGASRVPVTPQAVRAQLSKLLATQLYNSSALIPKPVDLVRAAAKGKLTETANWQCIMHILFYLSGSNLLSQDANPSSHCSGSSTPSILPSLPCAASGEVIEVCDTPPSYYGKYRDPEIGFLLAVYETPTILEAIPEPSSSSSHRNSVVASPARKVGKTVPQCRAVPGAHPGSRLVALVTRVIISGDVEIFTALMVVITMLSTPQHTLDELYASSFRKSLCAFGLVNVLTKIVLGSSSIKQQVMKENSVKAMASIVILFLSDHTESKLEPARPCFLVDFPSGESWDLPEASIALIYSKDDRKTAFKEVGLHKSFDLNKVEENDLLQSCVDALILTRIFFKAVELIGASYLEGCVEFVELTAHEAALVEGIKSVISGKTSTEKVDAADDEENEDEDEEESGSIDIKLILDTLLDRKSIVSNIVFDRITDTASKKDHHAINST